MKSYREIHAQITSNAAAIAAASVEIDKLSFKEEREALVKDNGRMGAYRALKEKADQNAGKIAELSENIYLLKVENLVLTDNMKAAIFAEALPVIREAFQKYEGKPYGPKTREAIREKVMQSGFVFYIDGGSRQDTLVIRVLNDKKCYDYRFPEVTVFTDYDKPFLTGNKINFAAANPTPPAYIDDTKGRAAAIIAAYNSFREAREAAEKACKELNNIMPNGRYYNSDAVLYKTMV